MVPCYVRYRDRCSALGFRGDDDPQVHMHGDVMGSALCIGSGYSEWVSDQRRKANMQQGRRIFKAQSPPLIESSM
jgi:hypothetical protein